MMRGATTRPANLRARSSVPEIVLRRVIVTLLALLALGAGNDAGILTRRATAGGWFLEPSKGQEKMTARRFSLDAAGARFAMPVVVRDAAGAKVLRSAVVVGESSGALLRLVDLERLVPLEAVISLDGKSVAVLAQDLSPDGDSGGAAGILVIAPTTGRAAPVKRRVELDSHLIAGRDAFAVTGPPSWLPGDEDVEERKSAPGPEEAVAPTFVRANGDRLPAKTPVFGEVVGIADGGFVAFGKQKLVRLNAALEKVWETAVGFDGTLVASADGARIAVADNTPGSKTKTRRVVLFDGKGAKTAEATLEAPVAIELAIAPDGAALLATSAPARSQSAARFDPSESAVLLGLSPDGTVAWRSEAKRDTPTRTWERLTLARGGKTVAAAFSADESGATPELRVLDGAGATLYSAEGEFDAFALDPAGTALWTQEGSLLSRLTLSTLRNGTATDPSKLPR